MSRKKTVRLESTMSTWQAWGASKNGIKQGRRKKTRLENQGGRSLMAAKQHAEDAKGKARWPREKRLNQSGETASVFDRRGGGGVWSAAAAAAAAKAQSVAGYNEPIGSL